MPSGWIKKLVFQGDSILYENIKCRKTFALKTGKIQLQRSFNNCICTVQTFLFSKVFGNCCSNSCSHIAVTDVSGLIEFVFVLVKSSKEIILKSN